MVVVDQVRGPVNGVNDPRFPLRELLVFLFLANKRSIREQRAQFLHQHPLNPHVHIRHKIGVAFFFRHRQFRRRDHRLPNAANNGFQLFQHIVSPFVFL